MSSTSEWGSGRCRGFEKSFRLQFCGVPSLLVCVQVMPDRVILDDKKSYLVSFENFNFCGFSLLLKIEKNENFQNGTNMTFYGLK
jgi:hypothetical protein